MATVRGSAKFSGGRFKLRFSSSLPYIKLWDRFLLWKIDRKAMSRPRPRENRSVARNNLFGSVLRAAGLASGRGISDEPRISLITRISVISRIRVIGEIRGFGRLRRIACLRRAAEVRNGSAKFPGGGFKLRFSSGLPIDHRS